jgi:succinyl-diaminopimelate desuccinylase
MQSSQLDPGTMRIDAATDRWLHDLGRMIAIRTVFPPGAGYAEFADLMEELFAPLGFEFERINVPQRLWQAPGYEGARVNLIARRRRGRPVCNIYCHVDTVDAGDGWTNRPFELTRRGNQLFGRGTADMKGAIAATLAALRSLEAAAIDLAFDPVLLFCTDEEGGLYPGVRYLAEQGLLEGHTLCLNGSAAPRIWAGCFGSLDMLVRVQGRAAHSGQGLDGINAIEEAVPVLAALMNLKHKVEARASNLPAPPQWPGGKLYGRLNITAINSGITGSAVSAVCNLLLNRRYAPEESLTAVRDEIERAIATATTRALSVTSEVVGHLAPVTDPDDGPHWLRWQHALAFGFDFAPHDFRRWAASSSSDMGFVQQAGLKEILLGGLIRPEARIHAADEFTTVTDISSLARSILAYLANGEIPPPAAAST